MEDMENILRDIPVKAERKIRKSKQRKKGTEKTSFLTETF
jgi:hypothetical protein